MVIGRWMRHWMQKWPLDVTQDTKIITGRELCKIVSHDFQITPKQTQTLFHQLQIHKQHQNTSQIENFNQYSSNK